MKLRFAMQIGEFVSNKTSMGKRVMGLKEQEIVLYEGRLELSRRLLHAFRSLAISEL
jgi:hypothetical protein